MSLISEKKDFKYAKIGDRKNNFSKVGHYTQMVWIQILFTIRLKICLNTKLIIFQ